MTLAPIDFNEELHQYSRGGVTYRSVTQVIADAGWCDYSFVAEDVSLHSKARGKSVHWCLALEDQGALNYRTVPAALRGYRRAWLAWKKASGFVPELIEWRFISEFGFAGTVDRFGSLPANDTFRAPTKAVIDLKSGPVAEWVKYQTCGYALGVEPRLALARRIRRIGVELRKNGTYSTKEFPLASFDSDISKFMKAVRC